MLNLLTYIGKVLNLKNSIVDNLYVLDDPNLVWDNEDLNLPNRHLKVNFDINMQMGNCIFLFYKNQFIAGLINISCQLFCYTNITLLIELI